MSNTHTMTLTITLDNGKSHTGEADLRNLTGDEVSITAGNLAYGMIEFMWGLLDD